MDLFSKHGFMDGDLLDEYFDLNDEEQSYGVDKEHIIHVSHRGLIKVINTFLIPCIMRKEDTRLEVCLISCCHNPIRIVSVNGVDMDDCWYGKREPPEFVLRSVEVPFIEIKKLLNIQEVKYDNTFPS